MPEIPDIEVYVEALRSRVLGSALQGVRLARPFLLRTVDPPLEALAGARVEGVCRLGKRIVIEVAGGPAAEQVGSGAGTPGAPGAGDAAEPGGEAASLFLVIHLMIAGRLKWAEPGAAIPKGSGMAGFDFSTGTLILTEAGTKRRASLHLVRGQEGLAALDKGGVELFSIEPAEFGSALREKNQTLKRALTDPSVVSGIGNAYSDEILHRAKLSPFKQTQALEPVEVDRLHAAARAVLGEWTERLRSEAGENFPKKVTAFREGMAVHGRFGMPCPVCGSPIERIVYAESQCNYCPGCQTDGRILADRALSRLLKDGWPLSNDLNRDREV